MHDPQHPPGFPPKAFYSLLALHSPYPRAVTSRPLLSRTDDIGTNTIGSPLSIEYHPLPQQYCQRCRVYSGIQHPAVWPLLPTGRV